MHRCCLNNRKATLDHLHGKIEKCMRIGEMAPYCNFALCSPQAHAVVAILLFKLCPIGLQILQCLQTSSS